MDDPFESPPEAYTIRDFKMERMILSPVHWGSFVSPVPLDWEIILFSEDSVNAVPNNTRGVYSFVLQPGIANHPHCSYLLYVGKAKDQVFRARYRQYLQEKEKGIDSRRVHISRMLQKWDGYLWFCYASVDNQDHINEIEDALLAAYLPSHNRMFPSQVRYALKSALE